MTDVSPHPSLRKLGAKQQRLMLLLNMMLFLTLSGGIITMMAITFSGGDLFDVLLLGVIGLVMMPLVALLSALLRYLDRWLSRRLDGAGQLLRESHPLTARLVPTGLDSKKGALVLLHPLGENQARSGPLHALINPSFRWSTPPRREIMVQLYCQNLQPGSDLVALQANGDALLGKVVDRRAYYRQMRLMMVAAVALMSILAVVMGAQAVREYRDYRQIERDWQAAAASADWPRAPATVRRAELATAQIPKGKIQVTGYWAWVEYEYAVTGAARRANTLYFCNRPTENRLAAEAWLTKYPVDAAVTARYDPADPARGVLEAGYTAACEAALNEKRLDAPVLGVVAGFLLVLVVVVLAQFRQYRRVLSAPNP